VASVRRSQPSSSVPHTGRAQHAGRAIAGPIEAAAYFVCAEAVTNVAKYASASSVRCEVSSSAGRVRVAVADDGVGGADPGSGSGLRGLADRIDALGGTFTVTSPAGRGTVISAELPLEGTW